MSKKLLEKSNQLLFGLLLWAFGWIMKFSSKINRKFNQDLKDKYIVLQIQTQDYAIKRHYIIENQKVRSIRGIHNEPSTTLNFINARYAMGLLVARDPMGFMQGVQDYKIEATGSVDNLMWFLSAAKHLKPSF